MYIKYTCVCIYIYPVCVYMGVYGIYLQCPRIYKMEVTK